MTTARSATTSAAAVGALPSLVEVEDIDAEIVHFRTKRCLPLGRAAGRAAAFDGRRIVSLMTPQRDLIELLKA